jgi:Kef-type K+ transport system membrane component KefB
LARAVVPPTAAEAAGVSLGSVVWEILGAILFGAILGGAVSLYLRWIRRELFLFAIMVTFFGAEVARLGHVEVLLTLLTAGFVTENVSRPRHARALRRAMERSAAPVFVVFFALAGASMHLSEVRELWPLVLPIVIIRLLAIWSGTNLGGRWGGASEIERKNVWMGLVSQAGVAIGLATVVAQAYPTKGAELRTLFLAVIAVNESIGPVLFRFALSRSGELSEPSESSPAPDAVVAAKT